jgi:hypothetical protein
MIACRKCQLLLTGWSKLSALAEINLIHTRPNNTNPECVIEVWQNHII